jgi:uncharacterized protein (TIGR00251 family)
MHAVRLVAHLFESRNGGFFLRVRVKPRASRSRVLGERAGELEVAVAAPPVEGKANEELVRILAEHFGVPKSSLSIERGAAGRSKLVRFGVRPSLVR